MDGELVRMLNKFLRFRWKGSLYQFRVLPNGLACAPRFFTKLLVPAYATLREEGHECFPYIDDSFVVADSFRKCQESIEKLENMLESLGFVVHPEKSEFVPARKLVFLGYELDAQEMTIALTEDKEEKFLRAAEEILAKPYPTIREVAGIIGLMIAYSQAFKYGAVHVKEIEREKIEALQRERGDFDRHMALSPRARQNITWWVQNIRRSGKDLRDSKPEVVLYTDASNNGWGAHMENETAAGRWSEREKEDHINVLELRAILLGLQSLCRLEEVHVRIMSDNTTALAYIKHQGGVKSPECHEIAKQIWIWAEERNIWLSGAHIPGVDNVLADYKSRHFEDNLEWCLSDKIFRTIVSVFGKPEVDLFASRLNHKLDRFVSWKPDPQAIAVDAFSLDWANDMFYAFPPFSCVGRVVEKILEDNAEGILVVPHWPTRPWWGRLIALNLRKLIFRGRNNNLRPIGHPDNVAMLGRSPLVAFRFCRSHC